MTVQATYDPSVFDVVSMSEAMSIILTPEAGEFNTQHRWDVETPYLAELIEQELHVTRDSLLLDYGCGVGRLSRALIEATGCAVVGVDTSANMRTFASRYVSSPRFTAMDPAMLDKLVAERGLMFDGAVAVWVLQHCLRVADDVSRLCRSLGVGGGLFVLDEHARCVPTSQGWVHDGQSVQELLRAQDICPRSKGHLPMTVATEHLSGRTSWTSWRHS